MSGPYDNIINLPHPTSKRHPRMSLHDRAAQFSPFAALSGHAAALVSSSSSIFRSVNRVVSARAELDRRQAVLLEQISEQPEITVTWFQPDGKKEGGRYITATGRLKKLDEAAQALVLTDGTSIPLEDVLELQSACFRNILPDG